MTRGDERDTGPREIDTDHRQRLLILAYTRLFLLPERADGSKLTTIASFGTYDVRIVELPFCTSASTPPLRVELYDRANRQIIDSVGCHDLQDTGAATEALITKALRRNDLTIPRQRLAP
jgi:hypothetical protein